MNCVILVVLLAGTCMAASSKGPVEYPISNYTANDPVCFQQHKLLIDNLKKLSEILPKLLEAFHAAKAGPTVEQICKNDETLLKAILSPEIVTFLSHTLGPVLGGLNELLEYTSNVGGPNGVNGNDAKSNHLGDVAAFLQKNLLKFYREYGKIPAALHKAIPRGVVGGLTDKLGLTHGKN